MIQPKHTIFYSMEKAIKTYRRYAQAEIKHCGYKVTIDQMLLLTEMQTNPEATQVELAEMIFKDVASVTRMIDIMVKNQLLSRVVNPENRRRNIIEITKKGEEIIEKLNPVVAKNRSIALDKISKKEIENCRKTLNKIFENVTNENSK